MNPSKTADDWLASVQSKSIMPFGAFVLLEPYSDLSVTDLKLTNCEFRLDLFNIVGRSDISLNTLEFINTPQHTQVIRQLAHDVSGETDVKVSFDVLTVTTMELDTPYAGFLYLADVAGSTASSFSLLNSEF